MRTIAIALLIAAGAAAEQPKQPAKQLNTEERLALENISLKEALLQSQYRDLQTAKQKAIASVCERLKVALDKCQIDPQTGAVSEKHDDPKK